MLQAKKNCIMLIKMVKCKKFNREFQSRNHDGLFNLRRHNYIVACLDLKDTNKTIS